MFPDIDCARQKKKKKKTTLIYIIFSTLYRKILEHKIYDIRGKHVRVIIDYASFRRRNVKNSNLCLNDLMNTLSASLHHTDNHTRLRICIYSFMHVIK